MSERFAAFSFVDRIDAVEPGKSVSGRYRIPDTLKDFRHALCCEAVGQCAAWSAMASLDFRFQPVAGIARSVEFFGEARPGATLVMSAEISRADTEAVTYDGIGSIDGQEVVRLIQCLGPMLPMEEFDEAENLRNRFEILLGSGAEPGKFAGVPKFEAKLATREETALSGSFTVPGEGSFFGDHFPRKPVFPGTLFLDLCVRFAAQLVEDGARPIGAYDTKLREFMPPESEWSLRAELVSTEEESRTVEVFLAGRRRPKRILKLLFAKPASRD